MTNTISPYNLELGKILPQSIELEEAVLGIIMQYKDALEEVYNILIPESFYKEEHQKIYKAISQLYIEKLPVDFLTVTDKLRKNKELESVGGPLYVTQLTNIGFDSEVEYHARIIQQKYISREVIRLTSEIQNKAFDESVDILHVINELSTDIDNLRKSTIRKKSSQLNEIGNEYLKELEQSNEKDEKIGVPMFNKVNSKIGLLQPGNLVILAGRPGMGKTYIMMKIAKIMANNNCPVDIFSLEMSKKELYQRMIAQEAGLENKYLRTAKLSSGDWEKINQAAGNIENLDIHIDDTEGINPLELSSKLHTAKKRGCKAAIIDYIQLMKPTTKKNNREEEVSDITRNLKSIGKELEIPIIALSQLNRSVENRKDKRPILSDLRESGAIEQDADQVVFLHRPGYYNSNLKEKDKWLIEFIYAKNRHGRIGLIELFHDEIWNIRENFDIF